MLSRAWRGSVRRRSRALVLLVLIGTSAGCSGGDRRQNVSGTVTLDGQPLTQGQILLHGPNNQLFSASIRGDGTFTVTDVAPGELQAAVTDPGARMVQLPSSGDPKLGGKPAAPKALMIPAKYQKPETSGLSFTVTPTTDQIEIKMLSK